MEEMSQEPTPWETAARKLEYVSIGRFWSLDEIQEIFREACEAHAATVTPERDRLAAQLKLATEDWAEDDTKIRDLCRPILGNAAVDGDSYGVPPMVELVELLIARLASKLKNATEDSILHEWAGDKIEAENAALAAQVKRLREALTGPIQHICYDVKQYGVLGEMLQRAIDKALADTQQEARL